MTEVLPVGRHDARAGSGAGAGGPLLLGAVLLGIGATAVLAGSAPVQRAVGVFVTVIVWAAPFVIAGAVLAALEKPGSLAAPGSWFGVVVSAVAGPSRVPWCVAESCARGGGTSRILARVGLGFVVAPTVVLGGFVAPEQLARWLPAVAVAAVAAILASAFAPWPGGGAGIEGRHADGMACGGADLEVPDTEAGITPRGREDRVARCADIIGVSFRLAVLGAAAVAIVAGLPPDAWVDWIRNRPALGVATGVVLGVVFPPVPETVGPAFVALAPFGPGAQIAFAVPALLGNVGFGRRVASFLPRRTALRFCAIAIACGIAAGAWGAVAG